MLNHVQILRNSVYVVLCCELLQSVEFSHFVARPWGDHVNNLIWDIPVFFCETNLSGARECL